MKAVKKQRAYKYPCYPNREQEAQLHIEFAAARAVYNWGLATRKGLYEQEAKSISYASKPDGLNKRLTALKKQADEYWPDYMNNPEWLTQASTQCLQNSLRSLDSAYKHFFRRVKANENPGYPKFKIKGRSKNAVTYSIVHCAYDHTSQRLWLSKQSPTSGFPPLRIKWDRPLPSEPVSCNVSQDSIGAYYISFTVTENIVPLPLTGNTVGIDAGLTDTIVTDSGYKSGNPKNTKKYAQQLKKLQRQLRLKTKGSNNREKHKRKIAVVHRKIANSRGHFLHNESIRIIREYDVIGVETLNIKGMLEDGRYSKSVADASLYELQRQLAYKADLYGKQFIKINQWFPSTQQCSSCGHRGRKRPVEERQWDCPECGAHHDRDVNAARNILKEALQNKNNVL